MQIYNFKNENANETKTFFLINTNKENKHEMKKKKPNYIITKRKDGVDIHLSNESYSHLHKELKCMFEAFCKKDVTLLEIGNACPIAMMLMASHEIVADLNVGDRMIDK